MFVKGTAAWREEGVLLIKLRKEGDDGMNPDQRGNGKRNYHEQRKDHYGCIDVVISLIGR